MLEVAPFCESDAAFFKMNRHVSIETQRLRDAKCHRCLLFAALSKTKKLECGTEVCRERCVRLDMHSSNHGMG